MHDIADWLEKLGMSEYAELFAENKINISALRYLTDQDLKDIGIPLGHRRIMLAAILVSLRARVRRRMNPPLKSGRSRRRRLSDGKSQ